MQGKISLPLLHLNVPQICQLVVTVVLLSQFCETKKRTIVQGKISHLRPHHKVRQTHQLVVTVVLLSNFFCDEDEEDSVAEGKKRQSDGGDTTTFSLSGEAIKGMECDTNGSKRSKRRASSLGGNGKFSTYSEESGKFEKRKSILKSKPVQVKPKKSRVLYILQ